MSRNYQQSDEFFREERLHRSPAERSAPSGISIGADLFQLELKLAFLEGGLGVMAETSEQSARRLMELKDAQAFLSALRVSLKVPA